MKVHYCWIPSSSWHKSNLIFYSLYVAFLFWLSCCLLISNCSSQKQRVRRKSLDCFALDSNGRSTYGRARRQISRYGWEPCQSEFRIFPCMSMLPIHISLRCVASHTSGRRENRFKTKSHSAHSSWSPSPLSPRPMKSRKRNQSLR